MSEYASVPNCKRRNAPTTADLPCPALVFQRHVFQRHVFQWRAGERSSSCLSRTARLRTLTTSGTRAAPSAASRVASASSSTGATRSGPCFRSSGTLSALSSGNTAAAAHEWTPTHPPTPTPTLHPPNPTPTPNSQPPARPQDAEKAQQALNNKLVAGRTLVVNFAQERVRDFVCHCLRVSERARFVWILRSTASHNARPLCALAGTLEIRD